MTLSYASVASRSPRNLTSVAPQFLSFLCSRSRWIWTASIRGNTARMNHEGLYSGLLFWGEMRWYQAEWPCYWQESRETPLEVLSPWKECTWSYVMQATKLKYVWGKIVWKERKHSINCCDRSYSCVAWGPLWNCVAHELFGTVRVFAVHFFTDV